MNDDLLLPGTLLSDDADTVTDAGENSDDFPEIGDIEPEDDMDFGSDNYEE
ncbi:MAG: hypothetical protein AAB769_02155 [Patescibacteria group bacterium]